ncbi:complement factor I isoform X2 [Genypterus blacodes]|uniref:complement factor I isoform X2 n=1 Tax=Genypterus blacodes TaxID=154954 RepID=UPI003F770A38
MKHISGLRGKQTSSSLEEKSLVRMSSAGVSLLLLFLLVSPSTTASRKELDKPAVIMEQINQQNIQQLPPHLLTPGNTNPAHADTSPTVVNTRPSTVTTRPTPVTTRPTPVNTRPAPVTTGPAATSQHVEDPFLGPAECLDKQLTRASCDMVFCLPWERCIEGHCSCKLPYMCPRENVEPVCGRDRRQYRSYCQVMAVSCQSNQPLLSHFGQNCKDVFRSSLDAKTGVVKLFIIHSGSSGGAESDGEEVLVCKKLWDMAAANVVCKEHGQMFGAALADSVSSTSLMRDPRNWSLPRSCVSIRCQGYETSLAECVIYDRIMIGQRKVATATCYQPSNSWDSCDFKCANKKCVFLNQTCNGVDDCGDRSDEMCCKGCRNKAFRCSTGVCVHEEAVHDKLIDCLDGEDESEKHAPDPGLCPGGQHCQRSGGVERQVDHRLRNTDYTSPKTETIKTRQYLEDKLYCGIPNVTTVDIEEVQQRPGRVKRVVGGVPAKPTQIQWQVALQEHAKIDCGGAYIGGCWVITAAHCVRQFPSAFKVKFSLWKKGRAQDTTDIIPVEDIHIHPKYNPQTYENDIALVLLEKLPQKQECIVDNPAISAVCVPWTPRLFNPNHTCTISGWGRTGGGSAAHVLLWANVSLIDNCQRFYGERFKPGMMCAGDLDGSVDSCQGDSGGPLVCQDELGVSYLWGIVSWGERCGQAGFPGVYTQVADYFDWIRLYTGWPAVTRFNS